MAHILYIEPDTNLAHITKEALEAAGHSVVHSPEAQGAIAAIDAHAPDVVILEVQLAGHNGVEFLYELRSYPEWQHIPVIVHSFVYPERVDKAALGQLGVVVYLYKPATTLERLGIAVERTVARVSAAA